MKPVESGVQIVFHANIAETTNNFVKEINEAIKQINSRNMLDTIVLKKVRIDPKNFQIDGLGDVIGGSIKTALQGLVIDKIPVSLSADSLTTVNGQIDGLKDRLQSALTINADTFKNLDFTSAISSIRDLGNMADTAISKLIDLNNMFAVLNGATNKLIDNNSKLSVTLNSMYPKKQQAKDTSTQTPAQQPDKPKENVPKVPEPVSPATTKNAKDAARATQELTGVQNQANESGQRLESTQKSIKETVDSVTKSINDMMSAYKQMNGGMASSVFKKGVDSLLKELQSATEKPENIDWISGIAQQFTKSSSLIKNRAGADALGSYLTKAITEHLSVEEAAQGFTDALAGAKTITIPALDSMADTIGLTVDQLKELREVLGTEIGQNADQSFTVIKENLESIADKCNAATVALQNFEKAAAGVTAPSPAPAQEDNSFRPVHTGRQRGVGKRQTQQPASQPVTQPAQQTTQPASTAGDTTGKIKTEEEAVKDLARALLESANSFSQFESSEKSVDKALMSIYATIEKVKNKFTELNGGVVDADFNQSIESRLKVKSSYSDEDIYKVAGYASFYSNIADMANSVESLRGLDNIIGSNVTQGKSFTETAIDIAENSGSYIRSVMPSIDELSSKFGIAKKALVDFVSVFAELGNSDQSFTLTRVGLEDLIEKFPVLTKYLVQYDDDMLNAVQNMSGNLFDNGSIVTLAKGRTEVFKQMRIDAEAAAKVYDEVDKKYRTKLSQIHNEPKEYYPFRATEKLRKTKPIVRDGYDPVEIARSYSTAIGLAQDEQTIYKIDVMLDQVVQTFKSSEEAAQLFYNALVNNTKISIPPFKKLQEEIEITQEEYDKFIQNFNASTNSDYYKRLKNGTIKNVDIAHLIGMEDDSVAQKLVAKYASNFKSVFDYTGETARASQESASASQESAAASEQETTANDEKAESLKRLKQAYDEAAAAAQRFKKSQFTTKDANGKTKINVRDINGEIINLKDVIKNRYTELNGGVANEEFNERIKSATLMSKSPITTLNNLNTLNIFAGLTEYIDDIETLQRVTDAFFDSISSKRLPDQSAKLFTGLLANNEAIEIKGLKQLGDVSDETKEKYTSFYRELANQGAIVNRDGSLLVFADQLLTVAENSEFAAEQLRKLNEERQAAGLSAIGKVAEPKTPTVTPTPTPTPQHVVVEQPKQVTQPTVADSGVMLFTNENIENMDKAGEAALRTARSFSILKNGAESAEEARNTIVNLSRELVKAFTVTEDGMPDKLLDIGRQFQFPEDFTKNTENIFNIADALRALYAASKMSDNLSDEGLKQLDEIFQSIVNRTISATEGVEQFKKVLRNNYVFEIPTEGSFKDGAYNDRIVERLQIKDIKSLRAKSSKLGYQSESIADGYGGVRRPYFLSASEVEQMGNTNATSKMFQLLESDIEELYSEVRLLSPEEVKAHDAETQSIERKTEAYNKLKKAQEAVLNSTSSFYDYNTNLDSAAMKKEIEERITAAQYRYSDMSGSVGTAIGWNDAIPFGGMSIDRLLDRTNIVKAFSEAINQATDSQTMDALGRALVASIGTQFTDRVPQLFSKILESKFSVQLPGLEQIKQLPQELQGEVTNIAKALESVGAARTADGGFIVVRQDLEAIRDVCPEVVKYLDLYDKKLVELYGENNLTVDYSDVLRQIEEQNKALSTQEKELRKIQELKEKISKSTMLPDKMTNGYTSGASTKGTFDTFNMALTEKYKEFNNGGNFNTSTSRGGLFNIKDLQQELNGKGLKAKQLYYNANMTKIAGTAIDMAQSRVELENVLTTLQQVCTMSLTAEEAYEKFAAALANNTSVTIPSLDQLDDKAGVTADELQRLRDIIENKGITANQDGTFTVGMELLKSIIDDAPAATQYIKQLNDELIKSGSKFANTDTGFFQKYVAKYDKSIYKGEIPIWDHVNQKQYEDQRLALAEEMAVDAKKRYNAALSSQQGQQGPVVDTSGQEIVIEKNNELADSSERIASTSQGEITATEKKTQAYYDLAEAQQKVLDTVHYFDQMVGGRNQHLRQTEIDSNMESARYRYAKLNEGKVSDEFSSTTRGAAYTKNIKGYELMNRYNVSKSFLAATQNAKDVETLDLLADALFLVNRQYIQATDAARLFSQVLAGEQVILMRAPETYENGIYPTEDYVQYFENLRNAFKQANVDIAYDKNGSMALTRSDLEKIVEICPEAVDALERYNKVMKESGDARTIKKIQNSYSVLEKELNNRQEKLNPEYKETPQYDTGIKALRDLYYNSDIETAKYGQQLGEVFKNAVSQAKDVRTLNELGMALDDIIRKSLSAEQAMERFNSVLSVDYAAEERAEKLRFEAESIEMQRKAVLDTVNQYQKEASSIEDMQDKIFMNMKDSINRRVDEKHVKQNSEIDKEDFIQAAMGFGQTTDPNELLNYVNMTSSYRAAVLQANDTNTIDALTIALSESENGFRSATEAAKLFANILQSNETIQIPTIEDIQKDFPELVGQFTKMRDALIQGGAALNADSSLTVTRRELEAIVKEFPIANDLLHQLNENYGRPAAPVDNEQRDAIQQETQAQGELREAKQETAVTPSVTSAEIEQHREETDVIKETAGAYKELTQAEERQIAYAKRAEQAILDSISSFQKKIGDTSAAKVRDDISKNLDHTNIRYGNLIGDRKAAKSTFEDFYKDTGKGKTLLNNLNLTKVFDAAMQSVWDEKSATAVVDVFKDAKTEAMDAYEAAKLFINTLSGKEMIDLRANMRSSKDQGTIDKQKLINIFQQDDRTITHNAEKGYSWITVTRDQILDIIDKVPEAQKLLAALEQVMYADKKPGYDFNNLYLSNASVTSKYKELTGSANFEAYDEAMAMVRQRYQQGFNQSMPRIYSSFLEMFENIANPQHLNLTDAEKEQLQTKENLDRLANTLLTTARLMEDYDSAYGRLNNTFKSVIKDAKSRAAEAAKNATQTPKPTQQQQPPKETTPPPQQQAPQAPAVQQPKEIAAATPSTTPENVEGLNTEADAAKRDADAHRDLAEAKNEASSTPSVSDDGLISSVAQRTEEEAIALKKAQEDVLNSQKLYQKKVGEMKASSMRYEIQKYLASANGRYVDLNNGKYNEEYMRLNSRAANGMSKSGKPLMEELNTARSFNVAVGYAKDIQTINALTKALLEAQGGFRTASESAKLFAKILESPYTMNVDKNATDSVSQNFYDLLLNNGAVQNADGSLTVVIEDLERIRDLSPLAVEGLKKLNDEANKDKSEMSKLSNVTGLIDKAYSKIQAKHQEFGIGNNGDHIFDRFNNLEILRPGKGSTNLEQTQGYINALMDALDKVNSAEALYKLGIEFDNLRKSGASVEEMTEGLNQVLNKSTASINNQANAANVLNDANKNLSGSLSATSEVSDFGVMSVFKNGEESAEEALQVISNTIDKANEKMKSLGVDPNGEGYLLSYGLNILKDSQNMPEYGFYPSDIARSVSGALDLAGSESAISELGSALNGIVNEYGNANEATKQFADIVTSSITATIPTIESLGDDSDIARYQLIELRDVLSRNNVRQNEDGTFSITIDQLKSIANTAPLALRYIDEIQNKASSYKDNYSSFFMNSRGNLTKEEDNAVQRKYGKITLSNEEIAKVGAIEQKLKDTDHGVSTWVAQAYNTIEDATNRISEIKNAVIEKYKQLNNGVIDENFESKLDKALSINMKDKKKLSKNDKSELWQKVRVATDFGQFANISDTTQDLNVLLSILEKISDSSSRGSRVDYVKALANDVKVTIPTLEQLGENATITEEELVKLRDVLSSEGIKQNEDGTYSVYMRTLEGISDKAPAVIKIIRELNNTLINSGSQFARTDNAFFQSYRLPNESDEELKTIKEEAINRLREENNTYLPAIEFDKALQDANERLFVNSGVVEGLQEESQQAKDTASSYDKLADSKNKAAEAPNPITGTQTPAAAGTAPATGSEQNASPISALTDSINTLSNALGQSEIKAPTTLNTESIPVKEWTEQLQSVLNGVSKSLTLAIGHVSLSDEAKNELSSAITGIVQSTQNANSEVKVNPVVTVTGSQSPTTDNTAQNQSANELRISSVTLDPAVSETITKTIKDAIEAATNPTYSIKVDLKLVGQEGSNTPYQSIQQAIDAAMKGTGFALNINKVNFSDSVVKQIRDLVNVGATPPVTPGGGGGGSGPGGGGGGDDELLDEIASGEGPQIFDNRLKSELTVINSMLTRARNELINLRTDKLDASALQEYNNQLGQYIALENRRDVLKEQYGQIEETAWVKERNDIIDAAREMQNYVANYEKFINVTTTKTTRENIMGPAEHAVASMQEKMRITDTSKYNATEQELFGNTREWLTTLQEYLTAVNKDSGMTIERVQQMSKFIVSQAGEIRKVFDYLNTETSMRGAFSFGDGKSIFGAARDVSVAGVRGQLDSYKKEFDEYATYVSGDEEKQRLSELVAKYNEIRVAADNLAKVKIDTLFTGDMSDEEKLARINSLVSDLHDQLNGLSRMTINFEDLLLQPGGSGVRKAAFDTSVTGMQDALKEMRSGLSTMRSGATTIDELNEVRSLEAEYRSLIDMVNDYKDKTSLAFSDVSDIQKQEEAIRSLIDRLRTAIDDATKNPDKGVNLTASTRRTNLLSQMEGSQRDVEDMLRQYQSLNIDPTQGRLGDLKQAQKDINALFQEFDQGQINIQQARDRYAEFKKEFRDIKGTFNNITGNMDDQAKQLKMANQIEAAQRRIRDLREEGTSLGFDKIVGPLGDQFQQLTELETKVNDLAKDFAAMNISIKDAGTQLSQFTGEYNRINKAFVNQKRGLSQDTRKNALLDQINRLDITTGTQADRYQFMGLDQGATAKTFGDLGSLNADIKALYQQLDQGNISVNAARNSLRLLRTEYANLKAELDKVIASMSNEQKVATITGNFETLIRRVQDIRATAEGLNFDQGSTADSFTRLTGIQSELQTLFTTFKNGGASVDEVRLKLTEYRNAVNEINAAFSNRSKSIKDMGSFFGEVNNIERVIRLVRELKQNIADFKFDTGKGSPFAGIDNLESNLVKLVDGFRTGEVSILEASVALKGFTGQYAQLYSTFQTERGKVSDETSRNAQALQIARAQAQVRSAMQTYQDYGIDQSQSDRFRNLQGLSANLDDLSARFKNNETSAAAAKAELSGYRLELEKIRGNLDPAVSAMTDGAKRDSLLTTLTRSGRSAKTRLNDYQLMGLNEGATKDTYDQLETAVRGFDDLYQKLQSGTISTDQAKIKLAELRQEIERLNASLSGSAMMLSNDKKQAAMTGRAERFVSKIDSDMRGYQNLGLDQADSSKGTYDVLSTLQQNAAALLGDIRAGKKDLAQAEKELDDLRNQYFTVTDQFNQIIDTESGKKFREQTTGQITDLKTRLEDLKAQYKALGFDKGGTKGAFDELDKVLKKVNDLSTAFASHSKSVLEVRAEMAKLNNEYKNYDTQLDRAAEAMGAEGKRARTKTSLNTTLDRATKDYDKYVTAELGKNGSEAVKDNLTAFGDAINNLKKVKEDFDNAKISADEANLAVQNFKATISTLRGGENGLDTAMKSIVDEGALTRQINQVANLQRKIEQTLANYKKQNLDIGKTASDYGNLQKLKADVDGLYNSLNQTGNVKINLKGASNDLTKFRGQYESLVGNVKKTTGEMNTLSDVVNKVSSRFTYMFSATRVIMSIIRNIRQLITTTIELDDKMTQLKVVTQEGGSTYVNYLREISEAAKETGSTISDLVDSTTTFARLGYSIDESGDLAKYVAMLQKVGDIEVGDAQDSVTSMIKAFDLDTGSIEHLMDMLVTTGNNFPISVKSCAIA